MRWQTVVITVHVLGIACAAHSGTANPAAPERATLDETFKLSAGGVAVIQGEDLQIGFDRVASDSRCPRGSRCITEGEAIVRVWLSKAPHGRADRELRTTPPSAAEALYESYRITLVALEPYPEVDREIRPSDYVATLLVRRF